MESKINFKNIKAYIQGNTRLLIKNYGPNFLKSPWWIQEQIVIRPKLAHKKCIEDKECFHCGCSIPGKFYSNTGCDLGCYPEIMDKAKWLQFKKIKIKNNLRNINWQQIHQMMEIEKQNNNETWVKNLGDLKKDTKNTRTVELFNFLDEDFKINVLSPSCPCLTIISYPDVIESNGLGRLVVSLDTSDKKSKTYTNYIDIRYNNIKRIRFEINYTVV